MTQRYLVEYTHLGRNCATEIEAHSVEEARDKLRSIAATGEVTGVVLSEIKGSSRLLTRLFGGES